MNYKYIDMNSYSRKNHFEYFDKMAIPYVGVTVNVDITEFIKCIKENNFPFFLSFCYCAVRAANKIPEFRQRIIDHKIIEFDECLSSHTVALDDGTYCYCELDTNIPYFEFIPNAINKQEESKAQKSISETKEEALRKFFISSVPWISYTSLINPVPIPADSNPRITWGKYFKDKKKILIPVSTLCHHAIVDGLHISKFYEALNAELNEVINLIKNSNQTK